MLDIKEHLFNTGWSDGESEVQRDVLSDNLFQAQSAGRHTDDKVGGCSFWVTDKVHEVCP